MAKIVIRVVLVLLALSSAPIISAQEYQFERAIGRAPEVGEPKGLAVDAAGNVLVTDRLNGRLIRISKGRMATPQAVRQLRLRQPTAVGIDPKGNIVVAEDNQVRRITPAGRSTRLFPAGHQSESKVSFSSIVFDQVGNIYLSDAMNNRVLKLDAQGKQVAVIGQPGKGPGEFAGPQGLAIDKGGNLYVADEYNNRIQKFDAQGKFVAESGPETLGKTTSQGLGPMGIATDSKGNVWVAAHTNFAVYKLDPSFRMLVRLETFGKRNGELAGPIAVAVDANDNVHVLDKSRRIQMFDPEGSFISKFAFPDAKPGELGAPTGVAVDAKGNLWVCDTANFRIQKFDSSGKFLFSFGQFGQGPGEFNGGESIAFDRQGNLYVADSYNHRVQKFDPNGKFLLKFGSFGSREGEFIRTKVVNTDPINDWVYVNDWHNARVQKFDLDGNFIGAFGNLGPSSQRVLGPTGLVIDRSGNVYVSSWFNNAILKFSSQGVYLGTIGRHGSGDGEFKGPARLAINTDGNLVVVDWGNSRVQVLDPQGQPLTKFGQLGNKEGMFDQPVGIAVDSSGRLFVSDANNARVEAFVRRPRPVSSSAVNSVRLVKGAGSSRMPTATRDTNEAKDQNNVYAHIAIYDVSPGMSKAFEESLSATSAEFSQQTAFLNERILKNLDSLTLQYATYSKYLSREAAEHNHRKRLERLQAYCRRTPEAHLAKLLNAYYPDGVSTNPNGIEFGAGRLGQIAHLGLFIPFPHYRAAYDDVLHQTKVLTRAKQPRGYIGEDVLDEADSVTPELQSPYSPKASELAKMSFNYGEYQTMEDAEDSYIARQQARDPKLITMERVFYSALQVPTRFYIFEVVGNTQNPRAEPSKRVAKASEASR